MPEQALGGIPLGFGIVVEVNLLNFHRVLNIVKHRLREEGGITLTPSYTVSRIAIGNP